MNSFVGEDNDFDFEFYSGFKWEPVKRSQYRETWSLILVLVSTLTAAIWIYRRVFILSGQPESKDL